MSDERHSPEFLEPVTRVPAADLRAAARLYATGGNGGDLLRPRRDRALRRARSTVMAIANLAMCTGNIGRPGVGVNPLRGQNNVQGACDMGSLPARAVRLSPHLRRRDPRAVREGLGRHARPRAGPAHPQHARRRGRRHVQGDLHPGRGHPPVRPQHQARLRRARGDGLVIVHDLFLNETANYAHVFLPGSTFLEKNGTFTNAERRIQPVRKVMEPANGYEDWEVTQLLANAIGAELELHPPERDHRRDRPPDAELRRPVVGAARRDRLGPVAGQRAQFPKARRSCTSRASPAARASSWSPNTCRPTRRPARAIRCC